MTDFAKEARDLWRRLETHERSEDEIQTIAAALDAAFSRGSASIADEATVERVRQAVRDEYGSRICHWAGAWRHCMKEEMTSSSTCACESVARAALAAITAPPAPLKDRNT